MKWMLRIKYGDQFYYLIQKNEFRASIFAL